MNNWIVLSESVIGPTHIKSGKPNQDCVKWKQYIDDNLGEVTILALADGHGSDVHFRSNVGASIAVDVAIRKIKELLINHPLSYFTKSRINKLPSDLVDSWRMEIMDFHQKNEITRKEQELINSLGIEFSKNDLEFLYSFYGCTLLSVVITDEYMINIQLGDGDIVCVDKLMKTNYPIHIEEEMLGDAVYSMCMKNAGKYFLISVNDLFDDQLVPELIMVTSDGYKNSFVDEDNFFQAAIDYLALFDSYSGEKIQKNLSRFLENTTTEGAGDDVSIGLLKRMNNKAVDFRKKLVDVIRKQEVLLAQNNNQKDSINRLFDRCDDVDIKLNDVASNYSSKIVKIRNEINSINEQLAANVFTYKSDLVELKENYKTVISKVHEQVEQNAKDQMELRHRINRTLFIEGVFILFLLLIILIIYFGFIRGAVS